MEIDDIIGPFNIYKLTFPDGKEYIGQVEGPPEKRWKNGHGYDGQPHLRQAIDEAGGFQNVEKEVVLSRYSGTLIDGLEDFFIGWFDIHWPPMATICRAAENVGTSVPLSFVPELARG